MADFDINAGLQHVLKRIELALQSRPKVSIYNICHNAIVCYLLL